MGKWQTTCKYGIAKCYHENVKSLKTKANKTHQTADPWSEIQRNIVFRCHSKRASLAKSPFFYPIFHLQHFELCHFFLKPLSLLISFTINWQILKWERQAILYIHDRFSILSFVTQKPINRHTCGNITFWVLLIQIDKIQSSCLGIGIQLLCFYLRK